MLAGDVGERSAVGAGADQVLPSSSENMPYCAPWSVRAQQKSRPSASWTTPGSCSPEVERTGIAHQSADSRQVAPSSSDRYQSATARRSKEL